MLASTPWCRRRVKCDPPHGCRPATPVFAPSNVNFRILFLRGNRGMSASFWWVNHSHTFRAEITGSYLWFANKTHKSKARSESEKNTQRLLPGDVIFSFAHGEIGAIGVVLGAAREAAKPLEFESIAEHSDSQAGWIVPVRFTALSTPLLAEERMSDLAPALPR